MPVPWASGISTSSVVTQVLLVINLVVFAAMALEGVAMNPNSRQLIEWGANFGPYTMGGQPWRLLTSMFLHIGLLHILFNMWFLWNLGEWCESLFGHWTFAAVYFISGIGASVASVWWRPVGVSAGASGAIFGIVGALVASHYLGEFSAPLFAVRARLRNMLFFAGYGLIMGTFSGRTDNAAHIGGLVTGLVFGALIARVSPEPNLLRRLSILLFVGLIVLGAGAGLYRSRSYLIHVQRGAELIEDNKMDQAIAQLQTAIRQRPAYAPAHFALAHAYFDRKQYPLAEVELKRVLELVPSQNGARYELGMVYFNQHRVPEAKETFTKLVQSDPQDGYAHLGLGMVLAAEQNHAAAVQEFKLAAQLEPDLDSVYYRMGLSEAQQKNYDAAIAAFHSQQQKEGDDADTETALAEMYRAKGMNQEADEAQHKAEQLKPAKK
ncbi:MAG TPA: rhomboid family intramembrane serine protease [Terriglobales bacterium]|nr:rhomboid family intramembrane serine protease [Terriglobales bacterium]